MRSQKVKSGEREFSTHKTDRARLIANATDQARQYNAARLAVDYEVYNLHGITIVEFSQDSLSLEHAAGTRRIGSHQLLARTKEHLVFLNTSDESQVKFKLPQHLVDEALRVRILGPDQIVLQENTGYRERGRVVRFITMTPEGIEHERTVQLLGGLPTDPRRSSLNSAYIFPTAGLWLLDASVFVPFRKLQDYQADTYTEALRQASDESWPGLVVLLLASTILATIVYRWQQKYSRPHTPMWTALVFLTTVPGFLAYWVMHPPAAARRVPHLWQTGAARSRCLPAVCRALSRATTPGDGSLRVKAESLVWRNFQWFLLPLGPLATIKLSLGDSSSRQFNCNADACF